MQTITCDVCKKKVENSLTGLSFHYYADHSICEACKDNLELQVKNIVRGKEPFSYQWYNKYIDEAIIKAIQKGKN